MAEKAAEKATGGEVDIDSKTGQVKLSRRPDGRVQSWVPAAPSPLISPRPFRSIPAPR
jgi:hypothetical protein